MPSLTDPAAVERAERAVKQLDRKKQDLLKEKVALTSSIKMKEERLAEMLQTLSIIEEDERKSGEELRESNRLHTGFRGLESMYLVEEKMLRTGCRMASNSASMNFGKVLTRFAVQEKAAIRGYSGGPGTTCTRAEVRDRARSSLAVRTMMNSTV